MGTKNNPGDFDCYTNAEPDEPMFILLARDSRAPALVKMWIEMSKQRGTTSPEKIAEALRCADQMIAWQKSKDDDRSQKAKEVEEPAAMVRRGLMIISPSDHGDITLHTAVMLPEGPLPPQIMFEGRVFKPDPSRGATYVLDTSVIETSAC